MKNTYLMICAISFIMTSCMVAQNEIKNLETFGKAYGYVKYFHPSSEATQVDWNQFSAYGASEVSRCKNQKEVIATLNRLFKPIGPGIKFSDSKQPYELNTITPVNKEGYELTYWQHNGVSIGMQNQKGVYKSVRVNQNYTIDESKSFGNLSMSLDAKKYIGKEIKYSAWVKMKDGSKGTGHLWFRVDKTDGSVGFFSNMGNNPITSCEWQHYELIGVIDESASNMLIGGFMKGKGAIYIDGVSIQYKRGEEWVDIPIKNSGFEEKVIGQKSRLSQWYGASDGYVYDICTTDVKEGKQCVLIAYEGKMKKVKGKELFSAAPQFGKPIEKEIGQGIFCQIPLSLYTKANKTYPKSSDFEVLKKDLNGSTSLEKQAVRFGNVINTYNVFQHFYPYFKEVQVDWNKEFKTALKRCITDRTDNDHLATLQKMTAKLKDGHIFVSGGDIGYFKPPITWEWIENQLVITSISKDDLGFKVGDVITKIDGVLTLDYMDEVYTKISAGTDGYLKHRAKLFSMLGKEGTEIAIEVNGQTNILTREETCDFRASGIAIQKNSFKELSDNIYYLNLGKIEMDEINSILPKLEKAKGIICDLRGYPNSNHEFITHLLNRKDTSTAWMRVPQIIFPDQENIIGYENHGWEMEPQRPYLGDKNIVFITDGRAISYAESFMSFIEGYDLATIVGQPTAGTNGNINPFELLGGFRVSWTGMKVVKHDGSQHHAVGILPHVYVEKTIEGVKDGRDEFLEKALEEVIK